MCLNCMKMCDFEEVAFFQKTEIEKLSNNNDKWGEYVLFLHKMCDYCIFWISQHIWTSESPRFCWQISNCLSRKNIWDPAEHLLSEPQHREWENDRIIIINDTKYLHCCTIFVFLNILTFPQSIGCLQR